ncbi:hypothetical protein EVAR_96824_1 [Eumeta japonica]|uniref:Uncharacterized protein n=1 Tax=Eumeta variegata TaxID=151549 RepID=A0A4C1WDN6_EUMVA|nr:hypothetical protein EVAR_96824_1 [Eumeta japonica]
MAAPKYDPNSLWVALSEFGEGNIFSVYPTLLAQLLLEEEDSRVDGDTSEVEKLILPSDKDWRLQKYFYLVGLQKTLEWTVDSPKRVLPLKCALARPLKRKLTACRQKCRQMPVQLEYTQGGATGVQAQGADPGGRKNGRTRQDYYFFTLLLINPRCAPSARF